LPSVVVVVVLVDGSEVRLRAMLLTLTVIVNELEVTMISPPVTGLHILCVLDILLGFGWPGASPGVGHALHQGFGSCYWHPVPIVYWNIEKPAASTRITEFDVPSIISIVWIV